MAAPTSVEGYLAALPEASRAALEKLRKTIKAAAPEATETISDQMPTFKDHGPLPSLKCLYSDEASIPTRSAPPAESRLVTNWTSAGPIYCSARTSQSPTAPVAIEAAGRPSPLREGQPSA